MRVGQERTRIRERTHISISGDTHRALAAHCKERNVTMASLVELLVVDITGDVPIARRRPRAGGSRADRSVIVSSARVVALVDEARARERSHESRHDFLTRKISAWLDAQGAA